MAQLHPTGVHHLALSTRDMKGQLEFWCDVLGCPVKALYWMHGVENTFHGFVELAGDSYVAFVQHPDNAKYAQIGVTHAGNPAGPVTAGTMQHVAFNVDTLDDLLALRDRIRSRGVQVLGPIDHGMCQSMYFAGPEGLALEIATGGHIDARAWIDPEVQGLCQISSEELEALKNPAPYERPPEPVAQPASDPAKPQMVYPTKEIYEAVIGTPDQQVWERMSVTEPPVEVD
jgi:catechol 2,3-dioxygenase-like lactoylglutathione lyase family enzyme